MKKYLLVFLIVAVALTASSQKKKYTDGYIVFLNGDTLKGQVQKRNDHALGQGISFKSTESLTVYTPFELSAFGFTGKQKCYQAINYEANKKGKKVMARQFGELLCSGQLQLFKVYLSNHETNYTYKNKRNHAYVIQSDTIFYTLSQYEKIKTEEETALFYQQEFQRTRTYSTMRKEYLGILSYIFQDCPELRNTIAEVEFYDRDMIAIVKKYNAYKHSQINDEDNVN